LLLLLPMSPMPLTESGSIRPRSPPSPPGTPGLGLPCILSLNSPPIMILNLPLKWPKLLKYLTCRRSSGKHHETSGKSTLNCVDVVVASFGFCPVRRLYGSRRAVLDWSRWRSVDWARRWTIDWTRRWTIDGPRRRTIDWSRWWPVNRTGWGSFYGARRRTFDWTTRGAIDRPRRRPLDRSRRRVLEWTWAEQ